MRNLVVGVDGGAASMAALDWAVRTVGADGRLHAVTAVGERAIDRHRLERELAEWTEPFASRVGELTTCVVKTGAARLLHDAGVERHADAVVIGAHVPPPLVPLTIGHTAKCLLASLDRPLVVVPDDNEAQLDGQAPIVAGVGHGVATDVAVRWAAELAEARGLPLGLVRATDEGPVFQFDGLLDLLAFYIDPRQREVWDREDVEAMAKAAQEWTDSPISVEATSLPGVPGHRLVDASVAASLLVVGQHRPLIAGSQHVGQPLRHALTNASCPVAVIPVAAAPIGDGGAPQ